jgi:1-acyl-sn-glycerol-3-phosphate acyltransferase
MLVTLFDNTTMFKTYINCLQALLAHINWPDPQRFVAPLPRGGLRWALTLVSPLLNQLILWQHGIVRLEISGHQRLKGFLSRQGGHPRMLVGNHTNFTDPQVVMAWQWRHHPHATWWIAGIEPMESLPSRLILTTNGTFSVDRGVLDRSSLQYAQRVLKEGQRPLAIFPEGEAYYRHQQLAECKPGAAQLLIKSKSAEATWLPFSISYRCFRRKPAYYRQQCLALAKQYELLLTDAAESLPNAQLCKQLIKSVVDVFWKQHVPESPKPESLKAQAVIMVNQLLHAMADEHGVAITLASVEDELPYKDWLEQVMGTKNKLRSTIIRRLRQPKLPWFKHFHNWLTHPNVQAKSSAINMWVLTRLENALTGQANDSLAYQQRVEKAISLCEKRMAELTNHQYPDDEQKIRWEAQLNTCRQAKLLAVLAEDATMALELPEDWDNTIYKIKLLLTNRHHYRGPKVARLTIGDEQTVGEGVKAAALTEAMVDQLKELVNQ